MRLSCAEDIAVDNQPNDTNKDELLNAHRRLVGSVGRNERIRCFYGRYKFYSLGQILYLICVWSHITTQIDRFFIIVLETRASDLSDISRKYREDARQLNKRSTLFKAAVTVCVIALLGFIARYVFW